MYRLRNKKIYFQLRTFNISPAILISYVERSGSVGIALDWGPKWLLVIDSTPAGSLFCVLSKTLYWLLSTGLRQEIIPDMTENC